MVEKVNGGNIFKKQRPKQKGHPHPWRDGTQLGRIC